ncbi:SARP family transcriptional regulator [Actinoplanes sp. N902-109]|nr:SARP family transcriptional regulator [Actinoplanes sp. N902-109]
MSRAYVALLPGLLWWSLANAAVGAAVAVLIAATQLFLDYRTYVRDQDAAPRSVADTAADLAANVQSQWSKEAQARGLNKARMLPVSWSAPAEPGADATTLRRIRGSYEQTTAKLAGLYLGIDNRQLIVLGEPGAGKTALAILLTLGVLNRRAAESRLPVPVLLPLARWDPVTEELDDWIVRTVAVTYYGCQERVARTLLDGGRLVPILDGLDEIPERGRREAVEKLSAALSTDRPLVVTCRSAEYRDLTEETTSPLSALLVEVAALPPEDVVDHLRRQGWTTGAGWEPVYERITATARSPLRAALSTPLMVSALCTVGRRNRVTPEDLLKRAGSRAAVEKYLLDGIIDAVYPDPAEAAQARRWLGFLARSLHDHRDREFAWWQLSSRMASVWLAPVVGICTGLLFMAATTAWIIAFDTTGAVDNATTVTASVGVGAAVAVLSTIVWFAAPGRPPLRLAPPRPHAAARLRIGFAVGAGWTGILAVPLPVITAVVLVVSDGWTLHTADVCARVVMVVISLAAVVGLACAVTHWLEAEPARAAHPDPLRSIQDDRRSALAAAWAGGLTFGALVAPVLAAGLTAGRMLSRLSTGGAGWPGGVPVGSTLLASVHDVRYRWFPTTGLAVGALFVLPTTTMFLVVLLTRAWPRFHLVRLLLAARQQLPRSLMDFLAGARNRELLRESGAAYQFRHARLQERLAVTGRPSVSTPEPGTARVSRTLRRTFVATTTAAVLVIVVAVLRLPADRSDHTLAGAYRKGPYDAVFSPHGTYVAMLSGADPDVRIYAAATGERVSVVPGNIVSYTGTRVMFSPNDRFAVVSSGGSPNPYTSPAARTTVWDLTQKRALLTVPYAAEDFYPDSTEDPMFAFTGNSDALIVSAPPDELHRFGSVIAWRLPAMETIGEWTKPYSSSDYELNVPAGVIAVRVARDRVTVWDLASGTELGRLPDQETSLEPDVLPGSGRAFVVPRTRPGGVNRWVDLVDRMTLRVTASFPITSAVSASAGDLAAFAGPGGVIRVVDVASGTIRATAHLHGLAPGSSIDDSPEISPDGFLVVARGWAYPTTVRDSDGVHLTDEDYRVAAYGTANHRALLLTGKTEQDDQQYELFDTGTGKMLAVFPEELVDSTAGTTFSADGRLLLVPMGNHLVRVYDATTGTIIGDLPEPIEYRQFSRYSAGPPASADGRTVLTRQSRPDSRSGIRVAIRDVATGRVLARATAIDEYETRTIAFSPDNTLVATVGTDGVVHVFNKADGGVVATFAGHSGVGYALTFSPDNTMIASGAHDDTVRLWRIPGR